jgi:hypothetical protein
MLDAVLTPWSCCRYQIKFGVRNEVEKRRMAVEGEWRNRDLYGDPMSRDRSDHENVRCRRQERLSAEEICDVAKTKAPGCPVRATPLPCLLLDPNRKYIK